MSLIGDRRTLWRYASLLALGAVVRAGAVLSLFPLLEALLADGNVMPWLALLGLLVATGWVIDYRVARAGFAIGFALLSGLEHRIAERLQRVPLGWFTPSRKADARKALTSSGRELCQAIAWLVTPAVNAVLTPALIGAGLLFIAPTLGIVALAAVPLLMLTLLGSMRLTKAADNSYSAASTETAARIIELAQAQAVLRAAGQADTGGTGIGRALSRQRQAVLRLVGFGLPGQIMFGLAAQAALLALAIAAVHLELTTATGVALLIVAVRFIEPFTTLAELAPALQNLRNTLSRLRELLNAPVLSAGTAQPIAGAPAIEFDAVTFGYEPGHAAVSGVSFTVPQGGTTAIVGPSGAGKSTLLALLARFHDATAGTIRVFGHDVRDYDPATLMGLLGIVFQDVYLFETTLESNVRLGNPHATAAEFEAAVMAAQLSDLPARLPNGWETRVGERGGTLSGGERQRVSIARALLKNAPILLLDEATAALDPTNEQAIVRALETGRDSRATIIVAHRLSTIARADHILFLDNGKITESGSLTELLARNGRFATYWRQRELAVGWTLGTAPPSPQLV